MKLTVNAYAKINLDLYIKGKRRDGYHELSTLMHSLPLCDRVTVEEGSDGIRVFCDREDLPRDERNIAFRAAKAYFEAAGVTPRADITIEKNIPVAGGFGGSSTDGAAVLFLLEKIYSKLGKGLGKEKLFSLAASLSADMPFCLAAICRGKDAYVPFCARCGGIGEAMTEQKSPIEGAYVLAVPCGDGLSSKEMYARFDGATQNNCNTGASFRGFALYNDFEAIAFSLRPDIEKLKNTIVASGSDAAMMSGSGSGVFGIFEKEETAELCAKALCESTSGSALCRIAAEGKTDGNDGNEGYEDE